MTRFAALRDDVDKAGREIKAGAGLQLADIPPVDFLPGRLAAGDRKRSGAMTSRLQLGIRYQDIGGASSEIDANPITSP